LFSKEWLKAGRIRRRRGSNVLTFSIVVLSAARCAPHADKLDAQPPPCGMDCN